jgi:hypothetical protein
LSYFTAYWKNDTWARKAREVALGCPKLDYAASNQFKTAGVVSGSTILVITVLEGVLFVAGRINVAKVLTNKADVAAVLGRPASEIWEGSHYIIPDAGDIDVFRPEVSVPASVAAKLEFESNVGVSRPKLLSNGKLDQQTLRNVRRLYPGAESPLLAAIGL